jgi:phosphoglycerate dehydrogenase-like enzyme
MPTEQRSTVLVTITVPDEMRPAFTEPIGDAAHVGFLQDETDRKAAIEQARAVISLFPRRELQPDEIKLMARVPLLQLISAGADQVEWDDVPESTIVASNVGAYAEPVAETVLAMILSLAKRLPQRTAELAAGQFHQWQRNLPIEGSTTGILGFGGIGRATARRMRALESRIMAINSTGQTNEPVDFAGTLADLDHVLRESDFVVIALPLNKATAGLIGRRELDLMKPQAILVNVSRAAVVDEKALYDHLNAHEEFGAAFDAWWDEPPRRGEFRPRFPFFELSNIIGTPHNSALVPGMELVAARKAAENVARFLRREPLTGVVHREDYGG